MKKGFTVIEVVIVIFIILILAAIAIPDFMKMRDRSKHATKGPSYYTIAEGRYDHVVYQDNKTIIYFEDGQTVIIEGEYNMPTKGTYLTVMQDQNWIDYSYYKHPKYLLNTQWR